MKRRFVRLLGGLLALAALASAAHGEPMENPEVDMLEVDHRLYELGYRDSACNGELDEVTINALRNFQAVNGLELTGAPDANTVNLLLSGEAISEQAYLNGLAQARSERAALANGSYGAEVEKLQRALRDLGYFSGSCDGAYGEATAAAVYRFQLANGLPETGIAGSAVFVRLYEGAPVDWDSFLQESCAAAGESGAHVRRIQLWLKNKGYFKGECTGRYGEATQRAVKRFQAASKLESSGDADLATCEALFTDVAAMLVEEAALRPGAEGDAAAALGKRLAELGYPAGERFGMRTELGVMQFQMVNGIDVTGVADVATQARVNGGDAKGANAFDPAAQRVDVDEKLPQRLLRLATASLGQAADFADSLEFVQYLYLKCNLPVMQRAQLLAEPAQPGDEFDAGQALCVDVDGQEVFGVVTGDQALVYCAQSGYIVMRYLDVMQPNQIWTLGLEAAQ